MNLLREGKVTRIINATAAGTTDINSTVIDMQGYEGVELVVMFGTISAGAVTSVKAQQGTLSDGSDMVDLEDTSVSIADSDDNGVVLLDIYQPKERYVMLVVNRGTADAVIDGAIAIQYDAKEVPVTQDTTVAGSEFHLSPDEGTA